MTLKLEILFFSTSLWKKLASNGKVILKTFIIIHLFIHILLKEQYMASETFLHIGRSQLHDFDQNSVLKMSRILIGKAADFDFFYLHKWPYCFRLIFWIFKKLSSYECKLNVFHSYFWV